MYLNFLYLNILLQRMLLNNRNKNINILIFILIICFFGHTFAGHKNKKAPANRRFKTPEIEPNSAKTENSNQQNEQLQKVQCPSKMITPVLTMKGMKCLRNNFLKLISN